jgi:hypothetical protein
MAFLGDPLFKDDTFFKKIIKHYVLCTGFFLVLRLKNKAKTHSEFKGRFMYQACLTRSYPEDKRPILPAKAVFTYTYYSSTREFSEVHKVSDSKVFILTAVRPSNVLYK